MQQFDALFLVIENIFYLFTNGTRTTEELVRAMDCFLVVGQRVRNFIQKI
jgi:hypothetical protein